MNRLSRVVGVVLIAAACSDGAETPLEPSASLSSLRPAQVTSSADAGPGSFRDAVQAANADASIGAIRFAPGLRTIRLQEPVIYTGFQALVIDGEGARLDGRSLPEGGSALVTETGGDLTIWELTVIGAPGNGITVKVPDAASGVLVVRLHTVTIRESGLHGILINDQAEYFTDPLSTSEAGSAASLRVNVSDSRFERNGFALIDSDGLRVNEGGEGTLETWVRGTHFARNGADGLELDERGAGDARFTLSRTVLTGNGSFTSDDFDDGIDVDEGGDGDLDGRFSHVMADRNFEQGVDLNENGAGDLRVTMADVSAVGNNEEGIEFEEDDDIAGGGDLEATLRRVTTRRNGLAGGDAGLKLREKGEGSLLARLAGAVSLDNRLTSGDDPIAGVLLREDEAGDLRAGLVEVTGRRNSGDGIQFEENAEGDLSGVIGRSTTSNNGGAGASLVQEAPGSGSADFTNLTALGNGGGDVVADGVAVQ